MEIRMIHKDGKVRVMIIEEPGDKFVDKEQAIKKCIDELAELVESIKREDMEG